MIEIKISQGAKPGHGGILPAAKVTEEIAEIRHVPLGKDVISPSYHTAFSEPAGLLKFMDTLRELSGGKTGRIQTLSWKKTEFLSICKAMLETELTPDFITVDGGEGGTGAAQIEFTNSVGTPCVKACTLYTTRCAESACVTDCILSRQEKARRLTTWSDLVPSGPIP